MDWKEFFENLDPEDLMSGNTPLEIHLVTGKVVVGRMVSDSPFVVIEERDISGSEMLATRAPTGRIWIIAEDGVAAIRISSDNMPETWKGFKEALEE